MDSIKFSRNFLWLLFIVIVAVILLFFQMQYLLRFYHNPDISPQ